MRASTRTSWSTSSSSPGGIGAEVRFIEYMDVGGATRWSRDQVVSRAEILERLAGGTARSSRSARRAPRRPSGSACRTGRPSASSPRRRRPSAGRCDRSRLTADGTWYLCLYAQRGMDLRTPLRDGASRAGAQVAHRGQLDAAAGSRRGGAEGARGDRASGVLVQIAGLRQGSAPRDAHARRLRAGASSRALSAGFLSFLPPLFLSSYLPPPPPPLSLSFLSFFFFFPLPSPLSSSPLLPFLFFFFFLPLFFFFQPVRSCLSVPALDARRGAWLPGLLPSCWSPAMPCRGETT